MGRCRGVRPSAPGCPNGWRSPRWASISATARAARSGSRWPLPTRGPQPHTGSAATSTRAGKLDASRQKRSVSPAKYTLQRSLQQEAQRWSGASAEWMAAADWPVRDGLDAEAPNSSMRSPQKGTSTTSRAPRGARSSEPRGAIAGHVMAIAAHGVFDDRSRCIVRYRRSGRSGIRLVRRGQGGAAADTG